jgi:hypothetical protein
VLALVSGQARRLAVVVLIRKEAGNAAVSAAHSGEEQRLPGLRTQSGASVAAHNTMEAAVDRKQTAVAGIGQNIPAALLLVLVEH